MKILFFSLSLILLLGCKRSEIICTLGGLAGTESDTCIDWGNAVFKETLWKDNR